MHKESAGWDGKRLLHALRATHTWPLKGVLSTESVGLCSCCRSTLPPSSTHVQENTAEYTGIKGSLTGET